MCWSLGRDCVLLAKFGQENARARERWVKGVGRQVGSQMDQHGASNVMFFEKPVTARRECFELMYNDRHCPAAGHRVGWSKLSASMPARDLAGSTPHMQAHAASANEWQGLVVQNHQSS